MKHAPNQIKDFLRIASEGLDINLSKNLCYNWDGTLFVFFKDTEYAKAIALMKALNDLFRDKRNLKGLRVIVSPAWKAFHLEIVDLG